MWDGAHPFLQVQRNLQNVQRHLLSSDDITTCEPQVAQRDSSEQAILMCMLRVNVGSGGGLWICRRAAWPVVGAPKVTS